MRRPLLLTLLTLVTAPVAAQDAARLESSIQEAVGQQPARSRFSVGR